MKEKVMIIVIQSFEQSLHLSKSTSMKSKDKCNPNWISISCASEINRFGRTLSGARNRTSSLNIKFVEQFGF